MVSRCARGGGRCILIRRQINPSGVPALRCAANGQHRSPLIYGSFAQHQRVRLATAAQSGHPHHPCRFNGDRWAWRRYRRLWHGHRPACAVDVFLGVAGITSTIEGLLGSKSGPQYLAVIAALIAKDEIIRRAKKDLQEAMVREPVEPHRFRVDAASDSISKSLLSLLRRLAVLQHSRRLRA